MREGAATRTQIIQPRHTCDIGTHIHEFQVHHLDDFLHVSGMHTPLAQH